MRALFIVLSVATLFYLSPVVRAADVAPHPFCENERATAIQNALQKLDKVEAWIPLVPPDESAYIAQEYSAFLNAPVYSEARGDMVIARPYFHAWKLHDEFKAARTELQNVMRLPVSASIKEANYGCLESTIPPSVCERCSP